MKREVIYRADAMAAIGNLKGLSDTDKSKAMKAVLDVPAIQTCDDAVSRQAAIAAVSNWLYDGDDGRSVDQLLSSLPSAQPKRTDKRTETHACDLISRAMLLEYIHNESVGKMLCDKYNLDGVIKQLPSAQPERKKGQWTDNNACPLCGFQPWYERDIHTLSFCPNCGADMRGEK